MILKWIFDRVISLLGLLILWPVLLVVAILVKVKMPGGPAFFVQKRVGRGGKLFKCHKFRTMTMKHSGSSVSVAGDSRIQHELRRPPPRCAWLRRPTARRRPRRAQAETRHHGPRNAEIPSRRRDDRRIRRPTTATRRHPRRARHSGGV